MTKIDFFTEVKANIKLSVPIVMAQLGFVLMGVTDNIMVGQMLGATALGTAGVANSLAFLIGSIAIGGFSVIAPLVSKAKAENDPEEVNRLFRAGIWTATGFSVILTLVGFLAAYFFEIFQQPEVTNEQAPLFLFIIILSNIPQSYFFASKQLADGLSFTNVAMVVTIVGLIFNVFSNYALISGEWFIPSLGLNGAAYSTLFTRCLMLAGILIYLYRQRKFKRYFLRKFNASPVRDLTIQIYKLSIPSGFQLFFEIGAFAFAVVMMGWIGELQMAAHQVAINIVSITYMMALGISIAGGIRVGEGRGMKNPSRILMSGNVTFILVTIFMLCSIPLILLFDESLVRLFIDNEEVMDLAVRLILVAALFQLPDGLQVAGLGALRGLSDVNIPTIITFFAYWVVALPLGYYLGFVLDQGAEGIWMGLFYGLTFSAVFLMARFYWLFRKRTPTPPERRLSQPSLTVGKG
jgi:MATE family multidrug resistance protein